MMRDSVKEFVDKEYGHTKIVLKKRIMLIQEECMKKGDLGLLVLQFLKHTVD
jgi:hypothetical protein